MGLSVAQVPKGQRDDSECFENHVPLITQRMSERLEQAFERENQFVSDDGLRTALEGTKQGFKHLQARVHDQEAVHSGGTPRSHAQ